MKKFPIVLFFSLLLTHASFSQVTYGSAAAGGTIQFPAIVMHADTAHLSDTAYLDLNCDASNDLRIVLFKGAIVVDGSNSVSIDLLNNSFEFCCDTTWTNFSDEDFHTPGETINCSGSSEWKSSPSFTLSTWGGWINTGPDSIVDHFIAYRKLVSGQPEGWIKISLDILENDLGKTPLTVSIPQVLAYCLANSVHTPALNESISISPNPTTDGKVKINSIEKIHKVEIVNTLGQVLAITAGNTGEITLPATAGVYILRIYNVNGGSVNTTVVRE